jgi:hypothetical protein
VLRKMLGAGAPRELKNRALNLFLRLFAYTIGLCGARRRPLAHWDGTSPLTDGFFADAFCR